MTAERGMTAAAVLVREARRIGSYDRSYCAKLCAVARDAGAAWEDRRLAALLFQWQLLEAPDDAELGRWLRELGLVQASGAGERIVEDVLAQGYTTTEVAPFVTEFRRHLARRGRVRRHFRAAARDEPPVRLSRSECKLALGRYLFRPGEVVDRVVASLRKSAGARAIVAPALVTDEMRGIRARLPEYEAAIVDGLVRDERIYWVAEATSSDVNALVEYPLGTVVVVVKPPGSDLEIEIKRCGRRRPCPIRVVPATRVVDWSHRLDGGSVAGMLHHEVAAICRLLHLYRRIHGGEAPVSLPVSVATVRRVPTGGGDVDVVDLLSDTTASAEKWAGKPKLFELLSKGIRPAGVGAKPEQVERFLGRMTPTQAVLAGTSSFRLDLLSRQLAPAGDHPHPDEELSDADRRHLADELLEEILGVYQPPEGDPDSHEHYLAAAFSQPENRRRADDAFRAVMQQLGTFWGTVWGIGGYSYGESFVARNVGLRTVWHQGRWQVRVIFMDHDDLHVYPESVESEDVATQALIRRLDGRLLDQHFLVGEPSEGCTVGHLERLYRVDETVAREGRVVLQRALAAAYRKALAAAEAMPELFPERFGEHLRDWDEVAGSFCTLRERSPQTVADWRRELRERLARRGCSREWLDAAFAMVERYEDYLVRGDFFYQALAVPADRVFVINLDRRRDRWEALLEAPPFRYARGIPERFPAVDGRLLRPTRELAHLFRSNDFQYRRGVIGCALSHYRIWQRVAGDDGARNALVFEDDVLFVRDFPRLYQELLAALPEDYDLVYVGGYPLDAAQEAALRGGDETALPPPDEYVGERIDPRLGVPRRTDIGTFAYLISRAGAGKLCARVKAHGFHRAVDYFLMDCWPDLRVYAAVPFLCWSVWEGSSDIQNDRESLFGEHRPGDLS